jgi:hypothetical protein
MTSNRVPGRIRTAALLLVLFLPTLPGIAADLASTYPHDAFPAPVSLSAAPATRPCTQARLRGSRPVRKPAAGASRHGSPHPELAPPERVGRPGVVMNEDDTTHS